MHVREHDELDEIRSPNRGEKLHETVLTANATFLLLDLSCYYSVEGVGIKASL